MDEPVSNPNKLPEAAGSACSAGLGARLRLLESDHDPDGWPAVQMRDITTLLDAVELDLRNVRCLKAASPGVTTFDEWEKELCRFLGVPHE